MTISLSGSLLIDGIEMPLDDILNFFIIMTKLVGG